MAPKNLEQKELERVILSLYRLESSLISLHVLRMLVQVKGLPDVEILSSTEVPSSTESDSTSYISDNVIFMETDKMTIA